MTLLAACPGRRHAGANIRLLLLAAVAGLMPCFAIEPEKATPAGEKAEELASLLAEAPPEIQADSLLRLAARLDLSRKEKLKLLERAFELASAATEPVRRVEAVLAARQLGDSDAAVVNRALGGGVDRLSLQCRTVQLLIGLDSAKACEWLDLVTPAAPATDCRDALRPAPGIYYSTVGECLQRCFSGQEIREGLDGEWLASRIRLVGASQIAPLASLLALYLQGREDRAGLAQRFAGELVVAPVEDRLSLAAWAESEDAIRRLAGASPEAETALVTAWGRYLNRFLSRPRCADEWMSEGEQEAARKRIAGWNAFVEARGLSQARIDGGSLMPGTRRTESARVEQFDAVPEYKELRLGYSLLRFGTPEKQAQYEQAARPGAVRAFLPIEERRKADWIDSATRFLYRLEQWRSRAEADSVSQFAMAADLYHGMLDIVPPDDPLWNACAASYVAFLRNPELRSRLPAIWLQEAKDLASGGPFAGNRNAKEAVAAIVGQHGDAVLQALIRLENLAPEYAEDASARQEAP